MPNKKMSSDIQELKKELKIKQGRIILLEDTIKNMQEEMLVLKAQLELLKKKPENIESMKESILNEIRKERDNKKNKESENEMEREDSKVRELKQVIIRQNQVIGRFKGSVVYPLYRLTSWFGRAFLGKK